LDGLQRRSKVFGTWLSDGNGRIIAFEGSQCARCNEAFFPAVNVCLACGHGVTADIPVEPRGVLLEFTRVWRAPEGLLVPYFCGYVRLGKGIRVFAQIDGSGVELRSGMNVVAKEAVITNDAGCSVIGYKFYVETG